MPAPKDNLKERLSRYRQIKISVIGRRSGKTISVPVWFVLEGDKLYLLPVQGSETQWYKNVLQNPTIRIDARGVGAEFRAVPVTGPKAVESVVEKFREKYGAAELSGESTRCGDFEHHRKPSLAGQPWVFALANSLGGFLSDRAAMSLFKVDDVG